MTFCIPVLKNFVVRTFCRKTIYTVSENTCHFYFLNTFMKRRPIPRLPFCLSSVMQIITSWYSVFGLQWRHHVCRSSHGTIIKETTDCCLALRTASRRCFPSLSTTLTEFHAIDRYRYADYRPIQNRRCEEVGRAP